MSDDEQIKQPEETPEDTQKNNNQKDVPKNTSDDIKDDSPNPIPAEPSKESQESHFDEKSDASDTQDINDHEEGVKDDQDTQDKASTTDDPEVKKEKNDTIVNNQDNEIPKEAFVVLCKREDINKECIDVLKQSGVQPIIINDIDESRSITEIIGQHPNVSFALIILAGDDFIYDRNTGKPGEAMLSAKPNAIFLFGYLFAKLGHQKTVIVYREQKSFRFPIGLHNAAFVPFQKNGAWEEILHSKLRAQGILS